MKRVALIGLDAAEPRLIDQLIAQGELPTLARLRQTGANCNLLSESTWRSGRVWETLLTGIVDYPSAAHFDPNTYDSFQLGSRRQTPFYALPKDLKLLALDVPYMSLWHDVPGAQVIWGGHDVGYPRASRPAGLLREIDARFGVHPAFHNDFDCAWHYPPAINTLADALLTGLSRRVEVARWLLNKFPDWNLFLTVLSEAHSAGEMFWHGVTENHPLTNHPTGPLARQRLLEIYRAIDTAVARLIAGLPPDTTIVVCSVHGMEANHYDLPSMALLPELLYRAQTGRKLLASPGNFAWRHRACPALTPASDQKWTDFVRARFNVSGPQFWLRELRRAIGWKRRKRPIEDLVVPIHPECEVPPDQIDEPRWKLDWQTTAWYRPYWPKMRAFAVPVFYDGRVRINLQGRDKKGIVPLAEYNATCDWVERLLAECRNPRTGEPVLGSIHRLREDNPLDPHGPDADLVITWGEGIDAFQHPRHGTIGPLPFRRTGGHTSRGFASIVGPGIAKADLGTHDALDMTPTLLDLLGHSVEPRSLLHQVRRAA